MALAQGRMAKEWVLSLFHQCRKQRVKVFFQAWGRRTKATTGRTLNFRTYNKLPARTIQSVISVENARRWRSRLRPPIRQTHFCP